MSIALDVSNNTTATAVSTITFSHTCTGTNLLLAVTITLQKNGGTTSTVSGVTYNGVTMTVGAVDNHTYANSILTATYYLVGPATGANNVVVTLSDATTLDIIVGATSFTGVAQTSPINGTFSGGNFSSPATHTVTTTVANSWIIGALYTYVISTAGTGETQLYDTQVNANSYGSAYYKPTTTTGVQTVSEALTGGAADWSYTGFAFAPAGATTFIEPGGDADFGIALWPAVLSTAPTASTTVVHGTHLRSVKYSSAANSAVGVSSAVSDAGGRFSCYFNFTAMPAATNTIVFVTQAAGANTTIRIRITSAGILQLWDSAAQKGSNGATLTTSTWNRLTLAWTITSTTVNQFRLYVNGVSSITLSNVTITNTGSTDIYLGNGSGDTTTVMYSSDHYLDNSSALTDTGDIWVTAKRPFSNGTTNGFTTQIGAGGSGYGTGHAPQVNERALSVTNGWSMVGAGAAITEEYSIEGKSVGDTDITFGTIIDFMGWTFAKALASETAQIVLAGATSNIALTSTNTMFRKIAGSTTYPAGGTDIGMVTTTALTTVSLFENGIVVAYIPGVAPTSGSSPTLMLLGV